MVSYMMKEVVLVEVNQVLDHQNPGQLLLCSLVSFDNQDTNPDFYNWNLAFINYMMEYHLLTMCISYNITPMNVYTCIMI